MVEDSVGFANGFSVSVSFNKANERRVERLQVLTDTRWSIVSVRMLLYDLARFVTLSSSAGLVKPKYIKDHFPKMYLLCEGVCCHEYSARTDHRFCGRSYDLRPFFLFFRKISVVIEKYGDDFGGDTHPRSSTSHYCRVDIPLILRTHSAPQLPAIRTVSDACHFFG